MFSVLRSGDSYNWDALGSSVRESPFLNVDYANAVDTECYTNKTDKPALVSLYGTNDASSSEAPSQTAVHQKEVSTISLQKSLREKLDVLKEKSYIIQERNVLEDVINDLDKVISAIPKSSTLTERPVLKRTLSLKLRRKPTKNRKIYKEVPMREVPISKGDTIVPLDSVVDIYDMRVHDAPIDTERRSFTQPKCSVDAEVEAIQLLWNLPGDCDVPVAKVCGTLVTDTDIRSLDEAGWLTDNVIDSYLKLLVCELAALGVKVLHLVSSTMHTILRGAQTDRITYALEGYKFVVGAHTRCSHWTLVVLDLEKKIIYFYNPVADAEPSELDSTRQAMCAFIAKCSHASDAEVKHQWHAGTMEHSSQVDSFNCGVYCLMFAECHLKGHFSEMENITRQDLTDKRCSVARKLVSFKHFLIDSCPKCGYAVDEAEQKLQCDTCGRCFHLKTFCIADDLAILNGGEQFSCMLCRIGFWTIARKDRGDIPNAYKWVDKVKTLEDLKQVVDTDVVITENATASLPCTIVEEEVVQNKRLKRKAIECVRFYIKETFLEEIESEPYMSTLRKVSGLQDQQLVTMLSQDKHLVEVYVEDVLLREALAAIFQAYTGDTYENANAECCSVLDSSRLRAMRAACAIGAAKKDTLNKKYQHLVGK